MDQNWSLNEQWGRTFDKQVINQLDHTESLAESDTFDLNTQNCLKERAERNDQQFTTGAEAHSCRCSKKSLDAGDKADNLNSTMVETTDATLMSSLSLHLLSCMKKFREKSVLKKFVGDVQLLCRVKKFFKRYISGDMCFSPTVHARRLPGQEGEGDGTVIFMRIKEVDESENCVSCCFGEDGRQRPGLAQNENFPCRREAEAEGDGHQKREAQSVNPSIESSETNFGEGHQKHEAQSVNSPVRYIKMCSPHPYPDTRRDHH